MKKIICLIFILPLLLSSCQAQSTPPGKAKTAGGEELRAAWLSFYEFPGIEGKTADGYFSEAEKLFSELEKCGINTVFLHLRAFCDSFYPSAIFPASRYAVGRGGKFTFDPLKLLLSAAGNYGIAVHAWINPFRVSLKNDVDSLPEGSPAKKLLQNKSTASAVSVLESGIYLNPASDEARCLILDGVREILDNYEVAGVHIDDYFYPETGKEIDRAEYESYVSLGGESPLDEWRRDNVSAFVASMYSLVHGRGKVFSVSPAANLQRNYEELYADVERWLAEPGYADWIIPQIYYGFENGTIPFADCAEKWAGLERCGPVKLICGLGFYKCGNEDTGTKAGREEWLKNDDIISRQIEFIRQTGEYGGFSLFSCGGLISPGGKIAEAEKSGLISLLS